MMIALPQNMTVEAFDEWAMLPENVSNDYEYVGGRVVHILSSGYCSEIAGLVGMFVMEYAIPLCMGRFTGANGGYKIANERYMPDFAYISYARQPQPSMDAYNPKPPDLAVEVLSFNNTDKVVRIKVANYLYAGVVTWVIDPDLKQAEIYVPGQPVQIVGIDGVIDGGTVLPGFSLSMRELFRIADRKLSDVQKPATDTPNA